MRPGHLGSFWLILKAVERKVPGNENRGGLVDHIVPGESGQGLNSDVYSGYACLYLNLSLKRAYNEKPSPSE